MSRKTKLSYEEIEAAEKAADDRVRTRATGFQLMKERDSGFGHLLDHNHAVRDVWMLWGEGGKFMLEISPYSGKKLNIILDTEEFRKLLRWA